MRTKIHTTPVVCLLSAMTLVLGCSSDDDVAPTGQMAPGTTVPDPLAAQNLETIDCATLTSQAIVDAGLMGDSTVECGLVTVPANWSAPNGNKIKLAVYKIPATGAKPATDPVVYLEGGPGGAGVASVSEFASGQSAYLRERSDIYVIDQRGTAYSQPALYCPEVFTADNEEGDIPAAHQACFDRLVSDGVNLADYNSRNNARDVIAVREALGIAQWNLYGLSYGTRLALTVMRDVPTGIRSVILDSVFPPEVNGFSESSYAHYFAIEQISTNCAADADCSANVGDMKSVIESGIARLDAQPVGDFTAAAYTQTLNSLIAEPEAAQVAVSVAQATDDELSALLADFNSDENDELPHPADVDSVLYPFVADTAEAMYYAVVCAEENPFLDVKAGPDLSSIFSETTQRVIEVAADPSADVGLCNTVYTVPPADTIESQPVQSNIPTLVLAGTADVATPPGWSILTDDQLMNSQYAEFDGLTHGLIGNNDCLNQITLAFLNNPGQAADQSCIMNLPRVDYETE